MKPVLIVTPWIGKDGGGVSEIARLEAHALHRRGVEVEVISLASPQAEAARADWPDVPIRLFARFGPANYGFSPALAWHLLSRRRDGVAHVHGLWMFPVAAVGLWGWLRGRRYAVTPHGMLTPWIMARSPRQKRAVSALYQRRVLRRAHAVQALTQAEAGEIAAYCGTGGAPPPIAVIGNFVAPAEAVTGTGFESGMNGRRLFLFLGRIHDKKGWRELAEAWDTVSSADPALAEQIGLVFAGWTDSCPDFEPRIEALSAKHHNIHWVGPLYGAEKAAALAAADIFVLPSKSEGLPMAVLEAWAQGVPALLTPGCNLPEGREAGAALECAPETSAIAGALHQFAAIGVDELASMGEAGRDLVHRRYSEKPVIDAILHQLIGQGDSDT